jgi:hypothetical protein
MRPEQGDFEAPADGTRRQAVVNRNRFRARDATPWKARGLQAAPPSTASGPVSQRH